VGARSRVTRAAPATPALVARAATVRATRAWVRAEAGDALLGEVEAALPAPVRDDVLGAEAGEHGDPLPFASLRALWEALDARLGATRPDWNAEAGAFAIERGGMQQYAGILRKTSPSEFLRQSVSIFQLYYAPGDMLVVQEAPGRAVLRLVGFDHGTPLFCRRQRGGLERALALAGGAEPRVRHVRCACEGDAFCEWELAWRPAEGAPREPSVTAPDRP
jgi:hypothetical protein